MAKINVYFNGNNYSIDEKVFSDAIASLENFLTNPPPTEPVFTKMLICLSDTSQKPYPLVQTSKYNPKILANMGLHKFYESTYIHFYTDDMNAVGYWFNFYETNRVNFGWRTPGPSDTIVDVTGDDVVFTIDYVDNEWQLFYHIIDAQGKLIQSGNFTQEIRASENKTGTSYMGNITETNVVDYQAE